MAVELGGLNSILQEKHIVGKAMHQVQGNQELNAWCSTLFLSYRCTLAQILEMKEGK